MIGNHFEVKTFFWFTYLFNVKNLRQMLNNFFHLIILSQAIFSNFLLLLRNLGEFLEWKQHLFEFEYYCSFISIEIFHKNWSNSWELDQKIWTFSLFLLPNNNKMFVFLFSTEQQLTRVNSKKKFQKRKIRRGGGDWCSLVVKIVENWIASYSAKVL